MKSGDVQNSLPKYMTVQGALLEDLSCKKYRIGDRFYTQDSVVEKFNVSLLTARRALEELEDKGYIRREHGRGTFVSALPDEPNRLRVIEDCAIGLLICDPHPESNAFQKLLMGIERQSNKEGYFLQIGRGASNNIIRMIKKKHVEGVIVIGIMEEEMTRQLKDLPVIVIGNTGQCDFHNIYSDSEMAGYKVAKYLLGLGHKKIGLISGNSWVPQGGEIEHYDYHSAVDALTMQGIDRAFIEAGMDAMANRRFFKVDVKKDEYLLTKELLSDNDRATAILVMYWLGIFGAFRAANEMGLKIPENISIVGYGDNVVAMHTTPLLTSVKLFTEEIGAEAVRLLSMLIKDPATVPKRVVWEADLVERDSCCDMRVTEQILDNEGGEI